MLTRRAFLTAGIGGLISSALSGCTDIDPGLDAGTPMPDAMAIANELKRSGAVDISFSVASDIDEDTDPLRAEYTFKTDDERELAFRGWASTTDVSWYNWHQGYKRHWGCDYAQAIRSLNLPIALDAGRRCLDATRFLANDSETAVIVLLDSRNQITSAARAIEAAWKAINTEEESRHTKQWLARDDTYGLEISLRIAAPSDTLNPSNYLGGGSACLYYTGDYTPYGAGKREIFDAKSFIAAAFDSVETAQED